jgi:glycosyltransferase involved in cell wall biosynthesis
MRESSEQPAAPAVSVILPTYNRARFLPQALASIRAQTFADWELIVVDDGSTDDTGAIIGPLTAGLAQPVRYVRQENQGAYGARNTGLDHARGRYAAFFDSDDTWLPHHLGDCVQALDANHDVDWVYGACQVVDEATARVLAPTTFYVDGKPRPFLALRSRAAGPLRVITDPGAIVCKIRHGLFNGLQNSVIRRSLFEGRRFEAASRNEAEDQLVVIRALAEGRRLGYLDDVHVIYRVHPGNSSAAHGGDVEKQKRVYRLLVAGFERLAAEVRLGRAERRALRRRLGHEYFWHLGYSLLWQHGQRREALAMFRRGLRYWPWDWRCWKVYAVALAKSLLTRAGAPRREAGLTRAVPGR